MSMLGLLGILIGLGLLISFAFRGGSVLLLAPLAALIAALFSREPLLAHWTQTFMVSAAGFLAQFFPLFLLGALFGKLMEDSGSGTAVAGFFTRRVWPATGGAGGGARRRARHVWRRQFVRCLLRTGADGAGAVSGGWYPAASDASG